MKIVGAVQIPHPQRMEIKFPTPWKTLIIKFRGRKKTTSGDRAVLTRLIRSPS